ncbi:hypothetical protein CA85_43200 [Allorhodopirellula solitaria]|uniref:Uncharacterized protein n=1 Tax=Allorhodopirellula solitaria TaxID=2527987 RepID=A0A5C5WZZ7_9BACT|nr:hypothetical protein CA85_43200 [Allorhodopirellula solitaria]
MLCDRAVGIHAKSRRAGSYRPHASDGRCVQRRLQSSANGLFGAGAEGVAGGNRPYFLFTAFRGVASCSILRDRAVRIPARSRRAGSYRPHASDGRCVQQGRQSAADGSFGTGAEGAAGGNRPYCMFTAFRDVASCNMLRDRAVRIPARSRRAGSYRPHASDGRFIEQGRQSSADGLFGAGAEGVAGGNRPYLLFTAFRGVASCSMLRDRAVRIPARSRRAGSYRPHASDGRFVQQGRQSSANGFFGAGAEGVAGGNRPYLLFTALRGVASCNMIRNRAVGIRAKIGGHGRAWGCL